ncbi:MAG TPA: TFIIB-type zinc ribbon-containing protein [Archaeoglobaceae archaeon]|nr:TFIIB-type zinc ribbon-containing protein [Archaeoglobaceae archaeon]
MRKILVCPVCKSSDIALDTGGYTGKYICKDCGYIGIAIEMSEGEYEKLVESEKIAKEPKREESKIYKGDEHRRHE